MTREGRTRHLAVIGAGLSGLATALYARRSGWDCTIFEQASRVGGIARTVAHGGFSFDTGAHRLHEKDPEVTAEFRRTLGADLARITAPSRIYHRDGSVLFPLSAPDVVRCLGPAGLVRSLADIAVARWPRGAVEDSLERHARSRYGRRIAERFLLNYSEKLWGVPARELSWDVSGGRLSGLGLKSVFSATFRRTSPAAHLDGAFLYPLSGGIGLLADRLAQEVGPHRLSFDSPVSAIMHEGSRVVGLVVGGRTVAVEDELVSTMPLPALVARLDPRLPAPVVRAAACLRYRSLIVVALFLAVPSVTDAATVYFPESRFSFTRVSEPRNRNSTMAPAGKTSLVAEIPCSRNDGLWNLPDRALADRVRGELTDTGWIRDGDVEGWHVERIGEAYPVRSLASLEPLAEVQACLGGFSNLRLVGRFASFSYSHIHDHFRAARITVEKMVAADGPRR